MMFSTNYQCQIGTVPNQQKFWFRVDTRVSNKQCLLDSQKSPGLDRLTKYDDTDKLKGFGNSVLFKTFEGMNKVCR